MFSRTVNAAAQKTQTRSLMVITLAVVLSGLSNQAAAQNDSESVDTAVVGSWKWMRDVDDNRIRCNLHVSEKDGELVATYDDKKDSKATVNKLKFEDSKLQFVLHFEDESKAHFKGELKKGRITGKMKWSDDVTDWKAVRFTSLADAMDTWNLSFTSPDGVAREPAIMLSEKDGEPVVGFVASGDEEADQGEISNVDFEDGVLTFDVALEFNGADLNLEYDLEFEGDKVEGTVFFKVDGGPSGDIEITGERKM